jgi:Tol biopolymer transport system component
VLTGESKPFNITMLPAGPVFAGDSAGLAHSGVFRAAADGSGYTRLNDQGSQGDVHPRWGPDRTRVAFTSDDRGQGSNALFIVNDAATELAMLVSDTSTRRARWNRDGSHIAFECGPKSAQNDVCVVRDVNGSVGGLDRRGEGTGKIFVTDFDDRQDGPAAFAWDPQDPNVLVVVRDELDIKQEMASTIYFVTADFQPLVLQQLGPLVDPQTQQTLRIVGTLDISPDGEFIVFAAEDASATGRWLYVIDRRGEALMPLTTGPTYDSHPVISPDGREVLFLREDPSKCMTDYWRVDIASGTETQVSLEQWCDFNPAPLGYDWSPDGKDIVLVGSEFIGDPTNLLIYGIPSGITAAEYETQRRLIGRAPNAPATVQDLQPSWRP